MGPKVGKTKVLTCPCLISVPYPNSAFYASSVCTAVPLTLWADDSLLWDCPDGMVKPLPLDASGFSSLVVTVHTVSKYFQVSPERENIPGEVTMAK